MRASGATMCAMQNEPSSFDFVCQHSERLVLRAVLVFAVLFATWLAISLVVLGLLLHNPASTVLSAAAALAFVTEGVIYTLR